MKALFRIEYNRGFSCLQAGERHGVMSQGMSPGGVADVHAAFWANQLVAKKPLDAVLEVALGQLSIEFLRDCQIAITGADFNVRVERARREIAGKVEEKIIPLWSAQRIRAGEKLLFSAARSGQRAYLAMSPNIAVADDEQKSSEVTPAGTNLTAGETVYAKSVTPINLPQRTPQRFQRKYGGDIEIDFIPGYQFDSLPDSVTEYFLNQSYAIDPSSSRIAYRFQGQPAQHDVRHLFSQGLAYGAIQLPPDGLPIVFLNDRPTMGGYPKLGCITHLAASRLVQAGFPQKVMFRRVSVEKARQQWLDFLAFFNRSQLA